MSDDQSAPETPRTRPQPQYGEYAPEGWEWKPPSEEPEQSDSASAGRIAGVPHNLGAPNSDQQAAAPTSSRAPRTSASDAPPPYRADDPAPRSAQPAAQAPTPQQAQPARPAQANGRLGDRVMTIVLLVLGGLGALYTAASLFQLPASFTMMAAALELENFSLPDSVRTISIVGALLVFAVYALNLVYAVQRVRSRRLAFWVPLVAAVVAGIVMFVFAGIAVTQVPDLMQATSDPDAFSKLLEFAANPPSE